MNGSNTLYRGLKLKKEEVNSFKQGETIHLIGYTSTSTDPKVALKFALQQNWIDKVVVGVDSVSHLNALVKIENSSEQVDFPLLGSDDPNLINPSKWVLT